MSTTNATSRQLRVVIVEDHELARFERDLNGPRRCVICTTAEHVPSRTTRTVFDRRVHSGQGLQPSEVSGRIGRRAGKDPNRSVSVRVRKARRSRSAFALPRRGSCRRSRHAQAAHDVTAN